MKDKVGANGISKRDAFLAKKKIKLGNHQAALKGSKTLGPTGLIKEPLSVPLAPRGKELSIQEIFEEVSKNLNDHFAKEDPSVKVAMIHRYFDYLEKIGNVERSILRSEAFCTALFFSRRHILLDAIIKAEKEEEEGEEGLEDGETSNGFT